MELNAEMPIGQLVSIYNTLAQRKGSTLVRGYRSKAVAIERIKALAGDEPLNLEELIANAPPLPEAAPRVEGEKKPARPKADPVPHVFPGVRADSIRGKIFTYLNDTAPNGRTSMDDLSMAIFNSSAPHTHMSISHAITHLRFRGKQRGFKIDVSKDRETGKTWIQLSPDEQTAAAQQPATQEQPQA